MNDTNPGAMAVVRPLIRARQIRSFTDEPIGDAELHAITEVARWTGSARNTQPFRFLTVRDRDTIRSLWEAGRPSLRSLETATALVVIVLPASDDPAETTSLAYDDGRAAERMLIAANMLGLGAAIAWVRPDVRATVRVAFGLPEDRMVRTIIALGVPSAAGRAPKSAPGQARLPREESVRAERWG